MLVRLRTMDVMADGTGLYQEGLGDMVNPYRRKLMSTTLRLN